MNATMTYEALRSSPVRNEARATGAVSGAPLTLLRMEGAAALAGATVAYHALGGRWTVFALLFLLPDLSMLGYRVGAAYCNAAPAWNGSPWASAALPTASTSFYGVSALYRKDPTAFREDLPKVFALLADKRSR